MADNRVVVIQKRVPSLTSTAEIAKVLNGEKFITDDTSMEYYKHAVSGAVIPFGGKDVGNLKPIVDTNKITSDKNEIANAIAAIQTMMTEIESVDEFELISQTLASLQSQISKLPEMEALKVINTTIAKIVADLKGSHEPSKNFNYGLGNQVESSNLMDASMFEYQAEIMRTMGQSGIINTRQYTANGNRPYHRSFDTPFASLNMHDHPNTYNLPGTAEIAASLNGYYVRTRHNDYLIAQPKPAGPGYVFGSVETCEPPAIPPSVLALATAEEQVEEMRQYFIAYATRNSTLRDYRDYFTWTLSYFEVWLEVFDENLEDPFSSPRHSLATSSARDLLNMALYFNYGGHKNRVENLAFLNKMIRFVDVNGVPRFATIKWRICAVPVGNQRTYPTDTILHLQKDYRTAKRYNIAADSDAQLKSRRARFRLDSNDTPRSYGSGQLVDELMSKVPGLSGTGAVLNETYDLYGANDIINKQGTSTRLNSAYYNRFYSMAGFDASGRSDAMRGFNDPTLWVAMTDQPRVAGVPSKTGEMRFSYAIPLEMILHTPLENKAWNPYAIPEKTGAVLTAEASSQGGVNNSTPKVYTGYNSGGFFHLTPAAFFSGTSTNDPADTDSPINYKAPDNSLKAVVNSGTRVFLPAISGITGQIRQRYPVYPSFYEGSHAEAGISALWEEIELLKTKTSAL